MQSKELGRVHGKILTTVNILKMIKAWTYSYWNNFGQPNFLILFSDMVVFQHFLDSKSKFWGTD